MGLRGAKAIVLGVLAMLATAALPIRVGLADGDPTPEAGEREIITSVVVPPVARLGIQLQPLTDGLRGYFHAPHDRGVLVADVDKDSPAEHAGVRPGDVVVSVNGSICARPWDVIHSIRDVHPGDHVSLGIVRDRNETTIDVTAGEWTGHIERHSFGPGEFAFKDGQAIADQAMESARKAMEEAQRAMNAHREEFRQETTRAMEEARKEIQESVKKAMEDLRKSMEELKSELKKSDKGESH